MFKNLSEQPIAEVQKEQVAKWKEEDLLHKCVSAREGAPSFVFYEGPPTANKRIACKFSIVYVPRIIFFKNPQVMCIADRRWHCKIPFAAYHSKHIESYHFRREDTSLCAQILLCRKYRYAVFPE